ncbi:DUF5105 domain-containing protein [Bacillus atrophaeus]|uniref:DUF5105 domain-containing protein n=1 Tax=Bacillus atrophaeus TaxID=1452 RepID=UPI00228203C8|nr:DUF5105 domain-containing protein [Bacillus atrophaeus]MCY8988223.1 DUF4352 domain-containing protein [Bacillus atrophaeus]
MFKKKTYAVFLILILTLFTAACSGSKANGEKKNSDSEKKSDTAEVKIDSTEYTLPPQYDNSASNDQLVLKVNVSVKNTGKDILYVNSNDFTLYQGDTKSSESTPDDYNERLQSSSLNPDKAIKGSLFYVVDKGKKYELVYNPPSSGSDKKEKSLTFKIDGSSKKILATADQLQNPAKALSAYVDILLFGKDNKDFEKITGDNKNKIVNEFNKAAKESYVSASGLSSQYADDKTLDKILGAITSTLSEKSAVQTKTKSITGDEAIVEATIKPVDASSLSDRIKDRVEDYYSKNSGSSYEDAVKYALNVYPDEFKKLGPASTEETVEVKMKKNDIDQWQLDQKDYRASGFASAFIKE